MTTPAADRRAERWLALLLRFAALVLLLAWPTVLMPTAWQAGWHARLGLGAFPDAPLTDYLTRTIAVLYGTRGVVYLVLASDVRRYRPLVVLFGWADVAAGVAYLAIDLHAGMPGWWTWCEGPSLAAFGALLLVVARRVPAG